MPQLITNADYNNLPDDDEECFVALEEICRRNFDRLFDELDPKADAEPLWDTYVSVVHNAAIECGVQGLSITNSGKPYERFCLFQSDVDGLITRLRLRSRRRSNPYSVQLAPNTRTKIEHHLNLLRDAIENSHLSEKLKNRLLKKLEELRTELGNRRLSFAKVMSVLAVITGVTTIGADGPEALNNITTGVTSIMRLINKDKETEEDAVRRLAPPPKALPAPSAFTSESKPNKHKDGGSSGWNQEAASSIDDDIPF